MLVGPVGLCKLKIRNLDKKVQILKTFYNFVFIGIKVWLLLKLFEKNDKEVTLSP